MPRFDVTIAGELNLDLILYGLPDELPPERELLADRMMLTLGSSSAIVAHNLAALGARVGFISRIGDDPLGQIALDRLAASGVDVSKVRYAGTIFDLTFEDLDLGYLGDSRHFHLSSFYLHRGLRNRIVELLQKMKAARLTVSLDTNDDPDDLWQGSLMEALRYVDVFLPNAREARKIAGTEDAEAALRFLAKRVPLVVMKSSRRHSE